MLQTTVNRASGPFLTPSSRRIQVNTLTDNLSRHTSRLRDRRNTTSAHRLTLGRNHHTARSLIQYVSQRRETSLDPGEHIHPFQDTPKHSYMELLFLDAP